MLGVVEIWQGHLEEARIDFVNALKLQPHNAHYLLHYGVLLARLVKPDQALENMLEARRLDPSNPLTHYQIGKCYRETGKFMQAREELETAVRLRPTLSPAFYQLGEVYRHLGEESKARGAFQRFEVLSRREKTEKLDPIDANLEN
jgi:tetratricopeptide (TPR) repeat protein